MTAIFRNFIRNRSELRGRKAAGKFGKCFVGKRPDWLVVFADDELRFGKARDHRDTLQLGTDGRAGWSFPVAFRTGEGRYWRMLDHQVPRQNERGDFGVAKTFQKTPDVSVDGLLPDLLARIEISTD